MNTTQEIDLGSLLAHFPSDKDQSKLVNLALDRGILVSNDLVQKHLDSYNRIGTKAKILEQVGEMEQARKLYLEESIECEQQGWLGDAARYAMKAGDNQRATILSEKLFSDLVRTQQFERAANVAIDLQDPSRVTQTFEQAIELFLKKDNPLKAAEIALKIADTQRAKEMYLADKRYVHAAKITEILGDEEGAVELYRKHISLLMEKNYDSWTQANLAKQIGDTSLAIEIELKARNFDEAASLANQTSQQQKSNQILEQGIIFLEKKAEAYRSKIEDSGFAQWVRKTKMKLRRKILLAKLEKKGSTPNQMYQDMMPYTLEQQSQPTYRDVARFFSEAAQLAQQKKEHT